ncbi:hypothetical protein ACFO5Q_03890 [Kordiimonas lipolytica]|uniref:Uncharacterized protein n=1 Tax=Kordiimonas lipolytica TaxID=1662421 RepID=A0ABV8U938_9PROT|nr:hypothetical protein [Kordiimonas lipolytica]
MLATANIPTLSRVEKSETDFDNLQDLTWTPWFSGQPLYALSLHLPSPQLEVDNFNFSILLAQKFERTALLEKLAEGNSDQTLINAMKEHGMLAGNIPPAACMRSPARFLFWNPIFARLANIAPSLPATTAPGSPAEQELSEWLPDLKATLVLLKCFDEQEAYHVC